MGRTEINVESKMDNALPIMKVLFFNAMDRLYITLPSNFEPNSQVLDLIGEAKAMGWTPPAPFMVGNWRLEARRIHT